MTFYGSIIPEKYYLFGSESKLGGLHSNFSRGFAKEKLETCESPHENHTETPQVKQLTSGQLFSTLLKSF